MMDWLTLELNHKEYYQDLLREAEKARLVREALSGRQMNRDIIRQAIIWLGNHLAARGQGRQPHTASDGSVQSLPVANRPQ